MNTRATAEYRALYGRNYDVVIFLSISSRIPLWYIIDEILEKKRPVGCYLNALYDMKTHTDLIRWREDISRLIDDGNPEIIPYIEGSHFPEPGNVGGLVIHLPVELQVKLVRIAESCKPEIASKLQENLIQKAA